MPKRKDGSDDEENLITVCRSCHDKLEEVYDYDFYDRLEDWYRKKLNRECPFCPVPYCDRENLKRHIVDSHAEEIAERADLEIRSTVKTEQTG